MPFNGNFQVSSIGDYCKKHGLPYFVTSPATPYVVTHELRLWNGNAISAGGNSWQHELYVAELWDVRVFAKCGALLGEQNTILHDYFSEHRTDQPFNFGEEPAFIGQRGKIVEFYHIGIEVHAIETAINLVGRHSVEYGHWILEHISKLEFIHLFDQYRDLPILVDDGMPESHYDLLQAIIGNTRKIIRLPSDSSVVVHHLVEITSPASYILGRDISVPPDHRLLSLPPHTHYFLRDAFKLAIDNRALDTLHKIEKKIALRRIFLYRSSSLKRRPANQDELAVIATNYGFQPVLAGEGSFADQLYLFSNATHLIIAGGSADFTSYGCTVDTRILYLYQKIVGNLAICAHRSELLNIAHRFLLGEPITKLRYDRHCHYLIDEIEFRNAIEAMISAESWST